MKMPALWAITILCLLDAGCSMYRSVARIAVQVPLQQMDECLGEHRNEMLAKMAWNQHNRETREEHHSADYRDGFIAGYADFLEWGGNGTPPAVPPFHYWLLHGQSPEGHQAAEDWFAGFRHGAAVAHQSGVRQWL